ncbi:MAG TPA: class I tRNA ligase family protein, partial [Candidatus Nanoarchaeia archaeon]|nr:class I tRNA ligase family protein [Candidatus Nanoarchaeia archaeon]
ETAPDWCISRNRFWATSIPVWKCGNERCKNIVVIGSVKELQSMAIETVKSNIDLHKHIVDNIHLKCSKCSGSMTRIPEVLDCWFESGSMPYGAKHYPFENKEWLKKNFPADFISEYIAQVRTWFYYMHVLSVLLFGKAPFKNVVVTGTILAEDGSKMSKSKNNYPDPDMVFDKYGADALRFYLMSSQVMRGQDLNFSESGVKEIYRQTTMLLTNIKNFYELFAKDNKNISNSSSNHILDKWILSKLHLLVRNVTNALEDYDTSKACSEIIPFIDELSTWYVRRSRGRFKSSDKKEKSQAIETLAYVLSNLSKLMAPITPFISEHLHQSFRNAKAKVEESVHMEFWPELEESFIDEKLNKNMKLTREIVSLSLLEREKAKVPVRQVLSKLEISGAELPDEYLDLIKAEVNVKKVELKKGKALSLSLDTKITTELLQEGISREIIRNINEFRKELNLTINDRILLCFETADKLVKESFAKFERDIKHSVQADEVKPKVDSGMKSKDMLVNKANVKIRIKILKS